MRKITLRRSEGFVTGVKNNASSGEFKIVDNMVLTNKEAEEIGTATTYDEMDARITCNRLGCKAFVRETADGQTKFYKILLTSYSEDGPIPEDETSVIDIDIDDNKAKFITKRLHEKNTSSPTSQPAEPKVFIFNILIFIFLVVILVGGFSANKSSNKGGGPTWEVDLTPFQSS